MIRKIHYAFFAGMMVALPVIYNSCAETRYKFSADNTTLGNPMTQVSNKVLYGICGVLSRCHPEVSFDSCDAGIMETSGFAAPLGLSSSSYNTLGSIFLGEQTGVLVGNQGAGSGCYNDINALSCSDPQVQAAYDASLSNPFSAVPGMIPPGACSQIFTPGINLEVPIELVDVGLSSNTASKIFLRTRTSLDTLDYDGTVTYSFETVATNTDGVPRNVSLVNSAGVPVGSISVPAGTTSPTRFRTVFNPNGGANTYRVQLDGTVAVNNLRVFTGRILVKQIGATQTKIYVPLTGGPADLAVSADDSTAAIDNSQTGTGTYFQMNPWYFSLWRKNGAAFSQLVAGQPWTLEAVLSTSTAGSTRAYASLFNSTSGLQVTASEISTTSATPTLISASFADSASNFTNLDDMEIRIRNDGQSSSNAFIYRSGLWVKLTSLSHAEIYYRYFNAQWVANSGQSQWDWNIVLLDKSLFTMITAISHEDSGFISALGTSCGERIVDIGSADSGTTGTLVPGSTIAFTSTTKTRKRTSPLSISSGHRFISETLSTSGPGACLLPQSRLVIEF